MNKKAAAVVVIVVLICLAGWGGAFWGSQSKSFSMTSFGGITLPSGQRGDVFLFFANHPSHSIVIWHLVDGKPAGTVGKLKTGEKGGVTIQVSNDTYEIEIIAYPMSAKFAMVPEGATLITMQGMSDGTITASDLSDTRVFLKRDFEYTLNGARKKVVHEFSVGFE